jgi:hypothetical protein
MNWQRRLDSIQAGDTVRFARRWVKENHRSGGDLPKAKGTVTVIEDRDGYRFAKVDWDTPDVPDLVNVLNLSKVKAREAE